jgi:hypothetical protein
MTTQAALPQDWVDEIFARLTIRYGRTFLNRWEGIDLDLVKADWAQELAGFKNWPDAIKWALAHMDPDRPPTVTMFRDIAQKAPTPERQRLDAPQADPDLVKTELAKLDKAPGSKKDPKDWARRIIGRHEAGERINPTTLRFAREALNMAPFKFAH